MAGVSAPTSSRHRLPDTSSRCVAESVTGTHDFVVANFSLLDGHIGVGRHVSSAPFTVGGHDWILKFYPDGYTADNCREGTSVYLSICNRTAPPGGVNANFTLSLVDRHGNASFVGRRRMDTRTYWNTNTEGFSWFFWKPLLRLSSRCLDGDCLTIRCVLTVIRPLPTEDTTAGPATAVPPPELPRHLERALRDGRGADLTFHVGGRAFAAHRFMLAARSPVFEAELFGPMMEKDARSVEVVGVEPAIFEMLLHFIYTDSLPPCNNGREEARYSAAAMQHLLVAADRFGLDRLKLVCEENLCRSIDVKTVTTTLALAEQHHCKPLKDACLAFMSPPEVLSAVLATEGFKHLMASCPLVLEESFGSVERK